MDHFRYLLLRLSSPIMQWQKGLCWPLFRLDTQWRSMCSNPDLFHRFTQTELIRNVRERMTGFIGAAHMDEVVFVPNASHGLNTVLRSFIYNEGDIICSCASIIMNILHKSLHLHLQVIQLTIPFLGPHSIFPTFLLIPNIYSLQSCFRLLMPKLSPTGVLTSDPSTRAGPQLLN